MGQYPEHLIEVIAEEMGVDIYPEYDMDEDHYYDDLGASDKEDER